MSDLTILQGDALEVLKTLPDCSVNCCVTSPPYYGLRDYGVDGQIGLEPTPTEFVDRLVGVFREVRRVLTDDGTCWVNMGDSYAGSGKGARSRDDVQKEVYMPKPGGAEASMPKVPCGLKPKDLMGIPWRLAFALQADGWRLRQDIIWSKPNPMPESVRDRCTKAHEYVFLLTKSARTLFWVHRDIGVYGRVYSRPSPDYRWVNNETGEETASEPHEWRGATYRCDDGSERKRWSRRNLWYGMDYYYDADAVAEIAVSSSVRGPALHGDRASTNGNSGLSRRLPTGERNKRSVWAIATEPYPDAHFATFPRELARTCILAGCPADGIVLDPFGGSGTTGEVALSLGRKAKLIELNREYVELIEDRCAFVSCDMLSGVQV